MSTPAHQTQTPSPLPHDDHRDRLSFLSAAALLLMAILAPVALGLLKDASNLGPVRLGVLLLLLVAILDVVVAWALMHWFEKSHSALSHLTMLLRVVYAGLLVVALGAYAPLLASGVGAMPVDAPFKVFEQQWNMALLIFGAHLLLLGGLIIQSRLLPVALGVLVMISGLGYALDSIFMLMWPAHDVSISVYTFVGEALLIVWLPIHTLRAKRAKRPGG